MTLRKSNIIPLIFVTGAFIMFCALGTWQLERLQWKLGQIRAVDEAQVAPVLTALPEDISSLTYHHVKLTGEFIYDKTIHLIALQQGMQVGYAMVTPFVLKKDGRIILVNRGFSPPGKASEPKGTQTVEGILRPTRTHRYFAPENNMQKNVWSYEDLDLIEKELGKRPLPLVVEVTGEQKTGVFPIPYDGKVVFRNDHLGYAIQWFALAIVSVVMGFFYLRKPKNQPSKQ
jgi:surfeit locus 1 family protein